MKTRFAVVCFCVAAAAVLSAATLEEIRLSEGYDDLNRITAPVYNTSAIEALDIRALTAGYDRRAKFVRRAGGGFLARAPEYDLNQKIDVAALLTDALRAEATAMGFKRAVAGGSAWRVEGQLKDIYLESSQIYMGSTLFYGYMDVELQVTSPTGQTQPARLRVHHYFGGYNAGFGRRDEAESGASHLLVEGAQEIVARLNRRFFQAPPDAAMNKRLEGLRGSAEGRLADLHLVALSGLPAAMPALLEMMPREDNENVRSAVIDALAKLGAPDAAPVLASRFTSEEDEDCRWYMLKALDYIGGADAERVLTTQGVKDEEASVRRLALRITGKPAR